MKIRISALVLGLLMMGLTACGNGQGDSDAADGQTVEQADTLSSPGATEGPEMVYASHILIPFQGCQQAPADAMTREEAFQLLSSIADSIAAGQITFAQGAARHSSCPSSEQGGFLGGFMRGQMVPEFENVAFNLQPGMVSGVFETGYGYHIVYREPSVTASHILVAYQGAERSSATRTQEEALQLIETIRDSIDSGELGFEDAALRYSDCPSGQEGGDLGPFSRHIMTPSFEDAAFALEVGDISGIVETPFGYHLIKRTE
ncbi:MAG: peptidylprolyl isomerase [Candidatus Fermentibacteraceae bacterium]|nr:peptidylprolyl isomerase [Candidatus Fermentibacteraceae bacterium]